MLLRPQERIFLAFDGETFENHHKQMLDAAAPWIGGVKIGITPLHTPMPHDERISVGSAVWSYIRHYHRDLKVFIDGKWKDIDTQMAGAVRGVVKAGAWGFTVHTSNRLKALKTVVENSASSLAIGVTVLTSMTDEDTFECYGRRASDKVVSLARRFASVRGKAAVLSPKELSLLSDVPLIKITPGIRELDAPPDDQNRTATASDAVRSGADYLVIGRPITTARNPADAAKRFVEQIAEASVLHRM